MKNLDLEKIIEFCSAKLVQGNKNKIINEIVIDSRKVKAGDLFIAIIGENTDGHLFIQEAVEKGAAAVVVERQLKNDYLKKSELSILKVEDTTKALQDIARNYRLTFESLQLIAVTGSAGKTTTKDMIYSVLSQKYNCLKTEGNFNNHIGLPLTLLRLTGQEDFAVVEMGMSSLGEIDLLAKIAIPDYGVVTNVAAAHLEQLGSIENIARAKNELIDNLGTDDLAILNFDNQYTRQMGIDAKAKVLSFGFELGADIRAVNFNFDNDQGVLNFKLCYQNKDYDFIFKKAGKHNIYNLMVAVIIGLENNLSQAEIQKAILTTDFSGLRMEIITLANGARIINDSYNANPLAVKAAVDVLAEMKGKRKIALLASMLELGAESSHKHREIGRYLAQKSIDLLLTVSKEAEEIAAGARSRMKSKNIISFSDNQSCIDYLKTELKSDDLLLVKGSRSNKLEEIVKALKIN